MCTVTCIGRREVIQYTPCFLCSLKQTGLESYTSQTLLLVGTVLVGIPVMDQNQVRNMYRNIASSMYVHICKCCSYSASGSFLIIIIITFHRHCILCTIPSRKYTPFENKPLPSLTPDFLQRYVYLDNMPSINMLNRGSAHSNQSTAHSSAR